MTRGSPHRGVPQRCVRERAPEATVRSEHFSIVDFVNKNWFGYISDTYQCAPALCSLRGNPLTIIPVNPFLWRQIWRVAGRESGSPELLGSPRTSPEVPRNFPGSFSATSPEVLSLWNLTAIQRFPGSFPDFPGSSPDFPGSSPDFPGGQPLSLGSLTPSPDSQKLSAITCWPGRSAEMCRKFCCINSGGFCRRDFPGLFFLCLLFPQNEEKKSSDNIREGTRRLKKINIRE